MDAIAERDTLRYMRMLNIGDLDALSTIPEVPNFLPAIRANVYAAGSSITS